MDLELKEIENFIGTENYYRIGFFKTVVTDGVKYVMNNGYSWLITDALAVIEYFKGMEFLVISLKINEDNSAKMIIDDGDGKVLYEQEYKWTDAKRELKLYWADGVLMLNSEY